MTRRFDLMVPVHVVSIRLLVIVAGVTLGLPCGAAVAQGVPSESRPAQGSEKDGVVPDEDRGSALPEETLRAEEPALPDLEAVECDGVGRSANPQEAVESVELPSDRLGLTDRIEFEAHVLPVLDTEALLEDDRARAGSGGPLRVGINRPLEVPLVGQWNETPDGGRLWTAALASPGAQRLRLHFVQVDLPPGAEIYVYAPGQPVSAIDPYTEAGPQGTGEFWAGSIPGDTAFVECYIPAGITRSTSFQIDEVGHMYRGFDAEQVGDARDARSPLDCMGDVACYGDWEDLSYAVAKMTFASDDQGYPAWYNCSHIF